MLNKLNWQVFSNKERNEAIEEIKRIISKNGGYIINFNLFSDLALSLTIEIEEKSILSLYKEIDKTLKISEPEPENLDINSNKDWWILMNVSFSKGKGILKVEIPNVPG
jgi:hypothetical protein